MNIESTLETYYNIPCNQWVKLSDVITVICLDQSANIYTDQYELYYFDTSTNLLSISKRYNYDKLESISPAFGSYKPYIQFDMNKISGFVATCVLGPYGTVIERPF